MKKKYQVFISSTYSDLIEERAAATRCLLDNDCIPVGMEQFPASDMSQMDYIKRMLDECDYYILILGGRYGSRDKDGIGFTEKEYDYAIATGIPVMSFVFDEPENLPSRQCEQTDELREKFHAFRDKVCSGKLVRFHHDIGSLSTNIVTSIIHCIRDFPATGWVRGDIVNELEKLKQQLALGDREPISARKILDEKIQTTDKGSIKTEKKVTPIIKTSVGPERPSCLGHGEMFGVYE